jgi:hypothetical protein
MEPITHFKFKSRCGKAYIFLFIVVLYCIYSFFHYGYDALNTITFISSIISFWGIRRIYDISERLIIDKEYKISSMEMEILGKVVLLLFGLLSFYLFFYKGVFGFYKSYGNLTVFLTFYHLGIIIASHQLVISASLIQSVFKSIREKGITRS